MLRAITPWLDEARRTGKARLRHGPAGAAPREQRSCIVVPLRAGREQPGFLYADVDGSERRFSTADRDRLARLAERAGAALAHTREVEGMAAEAARRRGELALIASIQEGIVAGVGFQGIVDTVGDRLRELFDSEDLSIRWWDPEADTLSLLV